MQETVLILDSDGVLVKPGTYDVPDEVRTLLSFTLEFFVVIASGRALPWCWEIGKKINAAGVFAENGLVFQFSKGEGLEDPWRLSSVLKTDIDALKKALGFQIIEGARAKIRINGQEYPVFVEPGKEEILTLGALEPKTWKKEGPLLAPHALREECAKIIRESKLKIGILGPHSDGHVEFLPVADDGRTLDKRIIPDILKSRFPGKFKKILAFVDGINDVSLALHKDVFPVTFANGTDVIKQIIASRNGLLVDTPGYEGGCAQALRVLRGDLPAIKSLDLKRISASVTFPKLREEENS